MFYSHDILTSSQYGVATIWLIATVGKTSQKKLSRKAIQDVDVPKACEKIIHPGAPLALRLQGSLLYGVSRVFSQQCGYVLVDAERCQSDMLSYFKAMQQSELDPRAGKTKRHLITLQDDPTFDPMAAMPKLDMLDWDMDAVLNTQTSSMNKYSQFTPLASQQSVSSGRNVSNISINLPDSSHGSFGLPDFGQSPTPYKPIQFPGTEADSLNPFGDDEHLGIGLEIDADGNMIGILGEEPELPPLPGMSNGPIVLGHDREMGSHALHQSGMDADPFALGEELALPNAEAFVVTKSANQEAGQGAASPTSETASSESEQTRAKAPTRRGRRRKANAMFDEQDILTRAEIRNRMRNYLDIMDAQRKRRKITSLVQAKQTAAALVFRNGLSHVGVPLDADAQFSHPLAEYFAGDNLRESLFGVDSGPRPSGVKGHRRGRSTAFGDEEDEDEEGRNTKYSKHDDPEIERFLHESEGNPMVLDDMNPELGMEEPGALGDRHSSTIMPWSRAGSAAAGSSVRGSAKKASPLPSRLGSAVPSIERHSDIGDDGMNDPGGYFPSSNS